MQFEKPRLREAFLFRADVYKIVAFDCANFVRFAEDDNDNTENDSNSSYYGFPAGGFLASTMQSALMR